MPLSCMTAVPLERTFTVTWQSQLPPTQPLNLTFIVAGETTVELQVLVNPSAPSIQVTRMPQNEDNSVAGFVSDRHIDQVASRCQQQLKTTWLACWIQPNQISETTVDWLVNLALLWDKWENWNQQEVQPGLYLLSASTMALELMSSLRLLSIWNGGML